MKTESPLTELKGIGEKTAQIFARAGILTINDLIHYYPRNYDAFQPPLEVTELQDGQVAAVTGCLEKALTVKRIRQLQIVNGKVRTEHGCIGVTWFNMPYLRNTLKPGVRYVFRGRVRLHGTGAVLEQPSLYDLFDYQEKLSHLQPVYPLVAGLTSRMLEKALRQALDGLEEIRDPLPDKIRDEYHLAEYSHALRQIHFPADWDDMMLARNRLVFDEFFFFILTLRRLRNTRDAIRRSDRLERTAVTGRVIAGLPYRLTGAQRRTWQQIECDMTQQKVMARLIQGDVGSGKTIIAFLAMILAAENGAQSALMVPTEVLAKQHYEAFAELVEQQALPYRAVLLTGSLTAKEKREAYELIESGEVQAIIGTHALIQEKVHYHKLALVITDEQHRFGVKQREALSFKGELPHILVMSATPIPRTLAVILYGDLDVSVIDELPADRLPIRNCVVNTSFRPKAYAFIEKEVAAGHQAYVICPMVEESETLEVENVITYTETLRQNLTGTICVEYLHGKMKPKEKNGIMERFLNREIQVLVSTTVIEVGVNVPNATVMMIENAERFGLAQLHQLRGRVGRGNAQSYCIMIHRQDNEAIRRRLDILNHSNDGFEIAGKDLQMRGPGDLFGIRQSGILDFQLADIFGDANVCKMANDAAGQILDQDPELVSDLYRGIRDELERCMKNGTDALNL